MPDVFGSCPQSIRALGLENGRFANKGKSEEGEAWLENIEIHSGFLPSKRTACSVGSRDTTAGRTQALVLGWKPPGYHFVRLETFDLSWACSRGGPEADLGGAGGRPSFGVRARYFLTVQLDKQLGPLDSHRQWGQEHFPRRLV